MKEDLHMAQERIVKLESELDDMAKDIRKRILKYRRQQEVFIGAAIVYLVLLVAVVLFIGGGK